jgi:broad specificity phosphatase PhoE
MHLFLVRHGETEHNVAGLLAGVSDSRLTNHGVLQTQRFGQYLTAHRNLRFTHIYASDLQRAYMTAEELHRHQRLRYPSERVPAVVKLAVLREQDFGSLELVPWGSARAQHTLDPRIPNPTDPSFRPQETAEAMTARAETFVADFILPLLAVGAQEEQESASECVAVVSHGLFLSKLWQTLLRQFEAGSVLLAPDLDVPGFGRPLEYLPSWNNTGYLEVIIKKPTMETVVQDSATGKTRLALAGHSMTVLGVNNKDHLVDLKRARGGIGSAPHDAKQKSLDGFFKKPS